jgi:hypothetical protein
MMTMLSRTTDCAPVDQAQTYNDLMMMTSILTLTPTWISTSMATFVKKVQGLGLPLLL